MIRVSVIENRPIRIYTNTQTPQLKRFDDDIINIIFLFGPTCINLVYHNYEK